MFNVQWSRSLFLSSCLFLLQLFLVPCTFSTCMHCFPSLFHLPCMDIVFVNVLELCRFVNLFGNFGFRVKNCKTVFSVFCRSKRGDFCLLTVYYVCVFVQSRVCVVFRVCFVSVKLCITVCAVCLVGKCICFSLQIFCVWM
uniref:(northern house mosquito) hypothetical protein n=1 Tax=Culex pipiens TaxID=7175 RepID=A0A8D8CG80_CULPI